MKARMKMQTVQNLTSHAEPSVTVKWALTELSKTSALMDPDRTFRTNFLISIAQNNTIILLPNLDTLITSRQLKYAALRQKASL